MRTVAEIIALADRKLVVAEMLLVSGFYDDAYYLGGYAFELSLKARICKKLFKFTSEKNTMLLLCP